jgi:two-component system, cell cycle sensor histidine kinase and response regulator CckA
MLLTDVIMPEMNGRILAEKLQAKRPELKCLFMSGYTADIISKHGVLDAGVSFIQKPFDKIQLAAKVRQVLKDGRSGFFENH